MSKVKTVLIIDDEPELANLVKLKLVQTRDYAVLTAHSGASGISMMREHQPSLIILDILMEDMSGFQVLEVKNSDPAIADIPVLLMSVIADEINVKRAMNLGAIGFLSKPVNFDKLMPEIDKVMGAIIETEGIRKKILVIVDDLMMQSLIRLKLEARNAECVFASNGLQGLTLVSSFKPDILLIDICLPDMNGTEVIRKIYSEGNKRGVRIYVISNSFGVKEELFKVGQSGQIGEINIDDFLSPKKFHELITELTSEKDISR